MVDVRRQLEIKEVSLVKNPANPAARVTLFKSEETPVADKVDRKTFVEQLAFGFDALLKTLAGDSAVVDLSKLNEKLLKRAQALPENLQKVVATLPDDELAKEDGAALPIIEGHEAKVKAEADLEAGEGWLR